MRIAPTVTEMKALITTTRVLLHSEGPAELFQSTIDTILVIPAMFNRSDMLQVHHACGVAL